MSYVKIPYEKIKQDDDEIYLKSVHVTEVSKGDQCYVNFSGLLGCNPKYDENSPVKLLTIEEIGENRWSSGDPQWHTDLTFVELPKKRYFGRDITMYLLRRFKPNN